MVVGRHPSIGPALSLGAGSANAEPAFGVGFFAGITIESADVDIDLNGGVDVNG
ncbi:hypothetical protein ACFYV7_30490 [Nocardia suismassiliense]|uniref:Uncharacterized protein n=1 Tax=Nocardia suismassiliense TaxID=2077092 RepID=A0ABW6R0Y9_9NOCA